MGSCNSKRSVGINKQETGSVIPGPNTGRTIISSQSKTMGPQVDFAQKEKDLRKKLEQEMKDRHNKEIAEAVAKAREAANKEIAEISRERDKAQKAEKKVRASSIEFQKKHASSVKAAITKFWGSVGTKIKQTENREGCIIDTILNRNLQINRLPNNHRFFHHQMFYFHYRNL